jgi:Glycosyl transferase family 2
MLRGYTPFHVPEVLYTWRMHPQSTASNIASKDYIFSSQRHVVEKFVRGSTVPGRYQVELSPLFGGNPDWRIRPCTPLNTATIGTLSLTARSAVSDLAAQLDRLDPTVSFIHLVQTDGTILGDDWVSEALTLMELFPDTDIVGGRVHDGVNIREAGYVFGYGGIIGCPDADRALEDPGYFAQMWKPHSVAAVSARHCVVRRDRLHRALKAVPADCDVTTLGLWLGASARVDGRRVVYTPFFEFRTQTSIAPCLGDMAASRFTSRYGFLRHDLTGYPDALNRGGLAPYQIGRAFAGDQRPDYATHHAWDLETRSRDSMPSANGPEFSILTTCYIRTEADLLRDTARSVLDQTWQRFQWIVLAHGPVSAEVSAVLDDLAKSDRVRVLREPVNFGIRGGLAYCLARAEGQFVLSLDADDLLTPDALSIIAAAIAASPDVDILYSDEDLLIEGEPRHPYYRPDFDPVLALTHSYVWHLIVFRRAMALSLGIYSKAHAEYAQDWSTLLRFWQAGHEPVHIPAVLYHWRQHSGSVSHSGAAFDGSRISVEEILRDVAARSAHPELYEVVTDPFLPGGSDSCLRRIPVAAPDVLLLLLGGRGQQPVCRDSCDLQPAVFARCVVAEPEFSIRALAAFLDSATEEYVLLLSPAVVLLDQHGVWDAIKHLELEARVMAIGGPLIDAGERVLFGAPVILPDGRLVDPAAGLPRSDPGPFSLALKPHCVGVLAVDMMLARRSFLREVTATMPIQFPLREMGLWAGYHAEAIGVRAIYDPAFCGLVTDPAALITATIGSPWTDATWRSPVRTATVAPAVRGLAAFVQQSFMHK